jgi:hypothetical protein
LAHRSTFAAEVLIGMTRRGAPGLFAWALLLGVLPTPSAHAQETTTEAAPPPPQDAPASPAAEPEKEQDLPSAANTDDDTPSPADLAGSAFAEAEDSPLPTYHSFRTANAFDGKLGLGALSVRSDPLGYSTGYMTFFSQLDYDGIGGSGFGIHFDGDLRYAPPGMFETVSPAILIDQQNTAYDCVNVYPLNAEGQEDPNSPLCQADRSFYRNPGTVLTGRETNYLRIDKLYAQWRSSFMEVGLGRMLVSEAAQAQVDGLQLKFGLGDLGMLGLFGGLKPNPWHQQIVGFSGGRYTYDPEQEAMLFVPDPLLPGTTSPDDNGIAQSGARSNNAFGESPFGRVLSTQFVTVGLIGSLRLPSVFADLAGVVDLFQGDAALLQQSPGQYGPDRIWLYTSGGWRIIEPLTATWRTSFDVVGFQPFRLRDAFVDLSWRNKSPISAVLSYFHTNTYATALAYLTYFKFTELGPSSFANPDTGEAILNADEQAAYTNALNRGDAENPLLNLNNNRLFVVDRDRVRAEVALAIYESMQTYLRGIFERRGDTPVLFGGEVAAPGGGGVNPAYPVADDALKYGGSVGLRDSFLMGAGHFDLRATWLDGYFQSTTALVGRFGGTWEDRLWMDVGLGAEFNTNDRTYGNVGLNPLAGELSSDPALQDRLYFTTYSTAYLLDTTLGWRVLGGLVVEGSYFGYVEEVPLIARTPEDFNNPGQTQRSDTTQTVHSLFGRALYRF